MKMDGINSLEVLARAISYSSYVAGTHIAERDSSNRLRNETSYIIAETRQQKFSEECNRIMA
jgi:hypothetical protein